MVADSTGTDTGKPCPLTWLTENLEEKHLTFLQRQAVWDPPKVRSKHRSAPSGWLQYSSEALPIPC